MLALIILNGYGAVTPTFVVTELSQGMTEQNAYMQLKVCYQAAIVEAANNEEKS
jgi:hypothetical protein